MSTRWMESPIGGLRIHAMAGLVTAIDFGASKPRRERTPDSLLDEAEAQLTAYFNGELKDFNLPLASEGSEFQKKVWGELRKVWWEYKRRGGRWQRAEGVGRVAKGVGVR